MQCLPFPGTLLFPAWLALVAFTPAAGAQSLLDRTSNMSAGWTGSSGSLYFHFLHRFASSNAPERKVSNVPTFLLAAALPRHLLAGINYSTNSTLATRYPNEWELFARWQPLAQRRGALLDVGMQVGFNNAANGIDAEVSLNRRLDRLHILVAARALTDPDSSRGQRVAAAGGAAMRLTSHVAVAADIAALSGRDAEERVAWSAGLQFAIPSSPHTLSVHATNASAATLQGSSRGTPDMRYGFEFTVPLTLRRYAGNRRNPSQGTPQTDSMGRRTIRSSMRSMAFADTRIEITVGTTVEWTNDDVVPHTVTADSARFDSGMIAPGSSWRRTFTQPGTYAFHCTPHPFMQGVIVVRAER